MIKINSRPEITRFTQFDERYNKQGNVFEQVFKIIIPKHMKQYSTHSLSRLTQSKVVWYRNKAITK